MTLDKLKANKKQLEAQIRGLILKFQRDNGVIVNDIDLSNHITEYRVINQHKTIAVSNDLDISIHLDLGV